MAKTTEISVDEYLAKRTISAKDGVVYRAAKMPKGFSTDTRSARFVMTDESIDSYGDEVKAKGCQLDRFLANPIALRNHRHCDVIGTWSGVEIKPTSVEGDMTLALEGTSELVDETFSLMSQGILRACSIGFMPIKIEMKYDDQARPLWEFIIHEWELYECSVVSVPANPNALAKSMKEGNMVCRDIIEEVLDTYAKMPSGLIVPRAEFEKAHKEGAGAPMSIVISLEGASEEFLKSLREAAEKNRGSGKIELDPGPDPIMKKLETTVEETVKTIETEIDEIPAEQTERRGLLKRAIDGIRSVFTASSEPEEPEECDDEEPLEELKEPALATEEEKNALLARLSKYEVNDLAA